MNYEELNHPLYKQQVRYKNDTPLDRKKLPTEVVMFLMAAEMQRLLSDNTELKMQLRNASDGNIDRVSYEVQIRDLMERMQQLTEENRFLKADNDRLTKLLRDMERALQQYEAQLRDYDPDWRKELDLVKKKLGKLEKSLGGMDIGDLKDQLSAMKKKCNAMDGMFGNQSPEDLLKMIEDLKKKAGKYDDLMGKLNGQDPSTLMKKLKDMDKLCKGMSPDDLLKELDKLRKKAKECDDMKRDLDRQRDSSKDLDDLRRQLADLQRQNEQLRNQVEALNQQLMDLRRKLAEQDLLIQKLNQEILALRELLKRKELELAQLNSQLANLQRQLQDAQRQLNDWQQRARQAEMDKQKMQKDLDNCLDELDEAQGNSENHTLITNKLGDLENDNDALRKQIQQLNDRIADLLRQLRDKEDQLRDLNDSMARKNKELQDAQGKLKDANDKLDFIKQEFGLTDADLDPRKRKNLQNLKDQKAFANLNPGDLLLKYLLQAVENERLGEIITRFHDEISQLQLELQQMRIKLDATTSQLSTMQQMQQSQVKQEDIDKLREFYENKIVLLTMEIQRMKKQVSQQQFQPQMSSVSLGDLQTSQRKFRSSNNYEEVSTDGRRVEDLLCLIVMMSAELQTLRQGVSQTSQGFESISVLSTTNGTNGISRGISCGGGTVGGTSSNTKFGNKSMGGTTINGYHSPTSNTYGTTNGYSSQRAKEVAQGYGRQSNY